MSQSIFDLSGNSELRFLIAEQMRRQAWLGHRFAKWMSPNMIKTGQTKEQALTHGPMGPQWSGAPIEMVDAFIQKGRTEMTIPVRNRLTGRGVLGGNQLFGSGEAAVYTLRDVKINRTRHSYSPPTGMEEQKTRQWAISLIQESHLYLTEWFGEKFAEYILMSMHAGYSTDIVGGALAGGLGQAIVSHPNLIIAGSGPVSYAGGRPGTAGYEGTVETDLDALTVSQEALTPQFLSNLKVEAYRRKIKPITMKNGFEFFPVWLKDAAWRQLQANADFKDLNLSLHVPELQNHPMGNGVVAYWDGLVIYTDAKMWCAFTNADDADITAGLVEYGPRPTDADRAAGYKVGNTITDLDTGAKAVGFLIGESCLSVGTGKKVEYTDETSDHGNVKEVGINFIQSVVRNETYDKLGLVPGLTAGDFYENTSSLAFVTYSPHALTY
jgi:hypothetical protein